MVAVHSSGNHIETDMYKQGKDEDLDVLIALYLVKRDLLVTFPTSQIFYPA